MRVAWTAIAALSVCIGCGTTNDAAKPVVDTNVPQAVAATIEAADSGSCTKDAKTTYDLARDSQADISAIDLDSDGTPEAVLRGNDAQIRLLADTWVSTPIEGQSLATPFLMSTFVYKQVEGVLRIHVHDANFLEDILERIEKDPTNPQRFTEGDVDYPFMLSWEADGDELVSWSIERTKEGLSPGDVWRQEYKLLDQDTAEKLTEYDPGSSPLLADLPASSMFAALTMTSPQCAGSQAQADELLSCLQRVAGDKTVAEWIERNGPGTNTRPESLPFECM